MYGHAFHIEWYIPDVAVVDGFGPIVSIRPRDNRTPTKLLTDIRPPAWGSGPAIVEDVGSFSLIVGRAVRGRARVYCVGIDPEVVAAAIDEIGPIQLIRPARSIGRPRVQSTSEADGDRIEEFGPVNLVRGGARHLAGRVNVTGYESDGDQIHEAGPVNLVRGRKRDLRMRLNVTASEADGDQIHEVGPIVLLRPFARSAVARVYGTSAELEVVAAAVDELGPIQLIRSTARARAARLYSASAAREFEAVEEVGGVTLIRPLASRGHARVWGIGAEVDGTAADEFWPVALIRPYARRRGARVVQNLTFEPLAIPVFGIVVICELELGIQGRLGETLSLEALDEITLIGQAAVALGMKVRVDMAREFHSVEPLDANVCMEGQ